MVLLVYIEQVVAAPQTVGKNGTDGNPTGGWLGWGRSGEAIYLVMWAAEGGGSWSSSLHVF